MSRAVNLTGYIAVMGMVALGFATTALAISPTELQAMLSAMRRPVVIDVRPRARYEQGHIPGAINIPAASLTRKSVSPFGQVVVYGDGIDDAPTQAAMDALARAAGVDVLQLDGGFAAWEAATLTTTRQAGLSDEIFEYVTIDDLSRIAEQNPDVVLLDLRPPQESDRHGVDSGIDLERKFPKRKTVRPDHSRWRKYREGRIGAGELLHQRSLSKKPLYVVIDEGDGAKAEAVARRLRGRGIRRIAILAGGDNALRPDGGPGTKTRVYPEN